MPAIFFLFKLRKHLIEKLGEQMADEVLPVDLIEGEGLSKAERADRILKVLNHLEQKLSSEQARAFRRSMSCNLTKQQIAVMDRAKTQYQTIEQQLEILNQGLAPNQIELREGGFTFYFNLPGCICGAFSKVPNARAPHSHCECCGANVQRIFKYWLSKDLDFETVQTFLLGDDNCIFNFASVDNGL